MISANTQEYLRWLEESFDWSKDVHDGYMAADGKLKDRVIRHDIMHLLVMDDGREKPIQLKFEDEYANAIVQAVLEGTPEISRVPYSSQCGRTAPKAEAITIGTIRESTIPKSVEFLTWVLTKCRRKLPENFRADVADAFVEFHMGFGHEFGKRFREKYKADFISLPIEDLLQIPFADLKAISLHAKFALNTTLSSHQQPTTGALELVGNITTSLPARGLTFP